MKILEIEERLDQEKIRLKQLYEISHYVENSYTMDCKRNIKPYERMLLDSECGNANSINL